MKSKKLTRIIFYMIIGIILLLQTKSKAVLQANGGTPATRNINDWLLQVRQMQSSGGALGLTDTINSDLTSGNKNLDIHMQKNTEYGAMAILSASSYGKQDKVNDGETTTGNSTGIQIKINNEWVSAGFSNLNVANFKNTVGRYKNIYVSGTTGGKVGDAIVTMGGWHGSSSQRWIGGTNSGLIRGNSGSIFSYEGWGNGGWAVERTS